MAQRHCRKFQSAEYGARTLQTDDRQTTDRQTDRQTTDGRTTTYSEHEHEFTFAKKRSAIRFYRCSNLQWDFNALFDRTHNASDTYMYAVKSSKDVFCTQTM